MTPRRDFELSEADRCFLEASGWMWETITDAAARWVVVHHHAVPNGYNHERVALASLLPSGYPDAAIDMFYVKPALARRDGKPINALSSHTICGEPWQRWSRHRTPRNPWRPGEDDLSTHILLVQALLEREIGGLN